jgi:two-component system response regulator DegU
VNAVGTVRVLVADDHPLFRQGLRRALEWARQVEVVGEARDGAECVALAKRLEPDVVLLDMRMPGMSGPDVARRLKEVRPQTRILALSIHDEADWLLGAVEAGVDGYVLKDVEPSELERAILAVSRGERYLQPSVAGKLMSAVRAARAPGPLSVLSEREWAVLQLLAEGKSTREIGQALFISEKTVKNHATSLFRKLGVEGRTQAVLEAIRRGWIRMPGPGQ